VTLCARLPLALAILAARAATRPDFSLRVLVAELREPGGGLDAFDGGDDGTDIRRVFSWSQIGLSPPAARAFGLLGLHPGPQIGVGAASALVELSFARTRKVLTELARAHLVEEVAPSRFTFHDLLRSYAQELVEEAEGQAARDAACGRLIDYYRQTAQRADRLLSPWRCPELWFSTDAVASATPLTDATGALDWFRTEHPSLVAVTEQAATARLDVTAYQLCWFLTTYLDREYKWQDLQRIQWIALGAARRLRDPRAEAYAERGLARVLTWQRRFVEADTHYDRALQLFGSIGDPIGTAQTHYSLSWIRGLQDQFDTALRHAQVALEIFGDDGPAEARAETLNEVGWFHAQLGDAEAALRYCREALALHREIGHREGEAQTLDSLGFIHHALGRSDEAIRCYRDAVARWSELSDRYYEAGALDGLGEVCRSVGRVAEAREAWERSRRLYAEMADPAASQVQSRLAQLADVDSGAPVTLLTAAPA
jgi:tetratricopeptide (TPR) repeat protein